jgi:transaldolase
MTDIDLSATKIFADGADRDGILALRENPLIRGFTTNPTLMRSAGIDDYESFALDLVQLVPDLPISFEVFSDDFDEMERQATKIASWGDQVFVKIPITNTRGNGVKLNVTALMTVAQVEVAAAALADGPAAFVSVFAGRIADTGRDPMPIMTDALERLAPHPAIELIWASPRELLNIVQAASIGCHVITVTHDVLKKLPTVGKDLDQFSLETVQMFHSDAEQAGYSL